MRALLASGINRSYDVVVGLASLHAAVGVSGGSVGGRVQPGKRTAGFRSSIYVVSHHLGGAGFPGEAHAMLCGSSRAGERLKRGSTGRRLETQARARGSTALRRKRNGERLVLTGGKRERQRQAAYRKFGSGHAGRRNGNAGAG